MLMDCPSCGALVWSSESTEKSSDGKPLFSICCQRGRVRLPKVKEPPEVLSRLMNQRSFKDKIRVANSLLAFTSIGANVDKSVMSGQGPYTFRIQGQNHHKMGSILPVEGKPPKFLQLYVFDTENEIQNRMRIITPGSGGEKLEEKVVEELVRMMDENNWLAKEFRKARDRFKSGTCEDFTIRLIGQKNKGRQFDLPTAEETAGLIIGNLEETSGERDIIIEYKSSHLQRISSLHPHYMALQYPIFFPYGEEGFYLGIPYVADNSRKISREHVTIREFYAYQIQTRLSEAMTIVRGGRLFHQYLVDAYTAIEEERLKFQRLNQKKLRADLYNNVYDAIGKGDTDLKSIGTRIILASSFTGGPRYMIDNYHDAMAICRFYGNPHLFVTITANPNWEEIIEHLERYGDDKPNDRPEISTRVFKRKLDELIADFKSGEFFGPLLSGKIYIDI